MDWGRFRIALLKWAQQHHEIASSEQMSTAEAIEALRDSADGDAQLRASWVLRVRGAQGEPSVLPALTEALQHPDFKVRAKAALVLGHLGEGYDALVAHLQNDPAAHVRMLCAATLSWPEYPPAIHAFIAALQDDIPEIVHVACRSLGRSGAGEAVAALRQVLDHPSWKVRFEACFALYRLGAVDQQVVRTLEALDRDRQSCNHRKEILNLRKIHPNARELTTDELLAEVRHALASEKDAQTAGRNERRGSRV